MRLLKILVVIALLTAFAGVVSAVPVSAPNIPTGQFQLKYANYDMGVIYNGIPALPVPGLPNPPITPANTALGVDALAQLNYPGHAGSGAGGAYQQYYIYDGSNTNGAGGNSFYHKVTSPEASGWYTDVNLTNLAALGGAKPHNLEDGWGIARTVTIYNSWFFTDLPHTVFANGQSINGRAVEIVAFLNGVRDEAVGTGSLGPPVTSPVILSRGYNIQLYAQPLGELNTQLGSDGRTGYNTYTGVGGADSILLFSGTAVTTLQQPGIGPVSADNYGGPVPVYSHSANANSSVQFFDNAGGIWADGSASNGEFTLTDWLAAIVNTDSADVNANIYLQNTNHGYTGTPSNNGPDDWYFISNDPVLANFEAVPEPVTMIGLFFSVAAVGGYLRRRRVA